MPRKRTRAADLITISRGIRMPRAAAPAGSAALRAYTDQDDCTVLALTSAARLWNACLPPFAANDWRIHLARQRGAPAPRRVNVVGHHLTLLPGEIVTLDGVRLTSPARTWLDLASLLALDDLVAAGDALVCRHGADFPVPKVPLTNITELAAVLQGHRGVRGIRTARQALALIRVGVDSAPETQLRLALVRAGLPEPVLNYLVRDPSGSPALWPDAAYPQFRIAVQYDGVHHGGAEQYERDIGRAEQTAGLQWTEVRISKADLRDECRNAILKVRRALKQRGWRP